TAAHPGCYDHGRIAPDPLEATCPAMFSPRAFIVQASEGWFMMSEGAGPDRWCRRHEEDIAGTGEAAGLVLGRVHSACELAGAVRDRALGRVRADRPLRPPGQRVRSD